MSHSIAYTEATTAADLQLIAEEHAHLAKILCELRELCDQPPSGADCHCCERGKVASCQGRLPSFFHDFREFTNAHFEHEESIMSAPAAISVVIFIVFYLDGVQFTPFILIPFHADRLIRICGAK